MSHPMASQIFGVPRLRRAVRDWMQSRDAPSARPLSSLARLRRRGPAEHKGVCGNADTGCCWTALLSANNGTMRGGGRGLGWQGCALAACQWSPLPGSTASVVSILGASAWTAIAGSLPCPRPIAPPRLSPRTRQVRRAAHHHRCGPATARRPRLTPLDSPLHVPSACIATAAPTTASPTSSNTSYLLPRPTQA